MSLPNMNPNKTVAGIAIDPYTRERVIPESKRADGSVRQQRKVRPGYTPQEDVSLFRGSRQTAVQNKNVPGYLPPGAAPKKPAGSPAGDKPLSKSAAKNAKRRAKKQSEKEEIVKDNWDSDSDGDNATKVKASTKENVTSEAEASKENGKERDKEEAGGNSEEITKKPASDIPDLTYEVSRLNLDT